MLGATMVSFDLRETLIPFSLLQIANTFRAMKPGEEMEVVSGVTPTDRAILKEVIRILPQAEYDLITGKTPMGGDSVTRLRLRKKKSRITQNQKGELSCPKSI
jgi:TusA-related sulfurtransferase